MTFTIDTSVKSPNFNERPKGTKPSGIVLHTTEGAWPSDLEWLCNPQTSKKYQPVSCHYVISPTGSIYQIVPDDKRAWHAGVGSYLGFNDWNSISLGIEVSHISGTGWPEVQREALAWLCRQLIAKYTIPQSRIIAHRWLVRPPTAEKKYDPTDWDNAGLMAWIEGLYTPKYAALWGDYVYYFEGSGIEHAWRPYADVLGKAVSLETSDARGHVWRLFEHGAIEFYQGAVEVYLPRKA